MNIRVWAVKRLECTVLEVRERIPRALLSSKVPVWLLAGLLCNLIVSSQGLAYTNQWEWKFQGISEFNTQIVAPSGTVYASKAQAVAAMRAAKTPGSTSLTVERITNITSETISYTFSAKPKSPIYSAWTYSVQGMTGSSFATEEAAVAALTQTAVSVYGPDTTVEPVGDWYPNGSPQPEGSRDDSHTYRINHPSWSPPYSYTSIRRQRTITCSSGYYFSGTAPYCANYYVGRIEGHPTECVECPSPKTGNPIDVATGDKSVSETDYSGGNLVFTRHYHSAILESGSALGIGWTHSFAARLVVSSGFARALVRPNGYHEGFFSGVTASGIKVAADGTDWIATIKNGERERYDAQGRLIRIIAPSGEATVLNYNSDGLLASVVGPYGHSLQFSYVDGVISTVTDPSGATIAYAYDGESNLSTVTFQDGRTRTYHYENAAFPNHLTGITDEVGARFATYSYDAQGRAQSSEHAGGSLRISVSYGSSSSVVTDALGAVTTYAFVPNATLSRRISRITKNGLSTEFAVAGIASDPQRRVTQVTDPRGVVSKFTYGGVQLATTTEAFGTPAERTTTFTWNHSLSRPTQILQAGRRSDFTYDSTGNVLTETITDLATGATRTTTRTRDSYGRVLTEDGSRTDVSDITTYTYYSCSTGYACGRLASVTNAASQTTAYDTYNAHGQPTQITDRNGVVTTLNYDARQRLISRTSAGETTALEYWPTGSLKKITLPDASYVLYTYDNAHRLTRIDDGEGNRIEYTLDAMGNRTVEDTYDGSGALVRTHSRVFDTLNQLWKDVNAAGTAAVTTVYGYDANGNQTSIAAPASRNTSQLYDELNRLKQITDAANGVTRFSYDANDNLTSVTDPRELATSYQYNGFGDLIQLTSPDTGVTTNTYDSAGNLATRTDARTKTGTYSYDALNRVTQIVYPDQTISFTYDLGTNAEGRLTGASDANHSLTFTYDALGRVIGKAQTVGAVTKSVSYGYTSGSLTSLVTPSGQTITYGYANGRIASMTLNGSTTILSGVLHEPFGPIAGWNWGNGTLAARAYDSDGKIETLDSAGAFTYGYDDAFRITSIADFVDASKSWTHGYDSLDRLTSASRIGQIINYSYDANGNRLTETGTQPATYIVSTSNNRLTAIAGTLLRTYSYDSAGNTIGYGGLTFTYSDAGRMTSVASSGTTNYVVNALGQRVKKSGPLGTRVFMYDESGYLIGEYDGTGGLIQETVRLGPIPVATLRPNGSGGVDLFYVHTDHLNTPRRVSRPTDNAIVWRWDSDPFGRAPANEDPDGDSQQFVYGPRFPGQYFDTESGLHYNYFRDYDPATGRYPQSDPIGLDAGINTYVYVDSNPVEFFDRLGLAKCRYSISKHTLICESDDLSRAGMVGPDGVLSGQGRCRDNPDCAGEKRTGPVPPGTYEMVPSNKYGGSWWLKEGFFTRQVCKLGIGRCEFFLHLGSVSEGCVTVEEVNPKAAGQFERIRRILNRDEQNTLVVEP